MDVGAPLTRCMSSTATATSSTTQEPILNPTPTHDLASPPTPPPTNSNTNTKRSFLARLRRNTSTPYPHPAYAASTSAIPMRTTTSQEGERRIGVAGVKKNQVGVPIMIGMNRSEVFGPSTSIKHGFALEDEIEWQRVKTLPRVRLVPPPEDEGEPIMLYPPPHFVRPATPPPTLPHPFLSPPSSPPTSPPRRPGSPPQSPPRRPTSIYSNSPTWAGMADGFVLPPPKFTRTGAGWGGAPISMGVILPKKREEVNEDRRRRMSGVSVNGVAWNKVGSPPRSPPGLGGRMRSVESQEEIAANKKMRIERDHKLALDTVVDVDVPSVFQVPTSPPAIMVAEPFQVDAIAATDPNPCASPGPLTSIEDALSLTSGETANVTPWDTVAAEPMIIDHSPPSEPIPDASCEHQANTKSPVRKAVRKSRALSLSAAFSSSSSLKNMEVPPLPSIPARPPIRKQKSLKQFFFSSSTPPGATINAPPIPSIPVLPGQRQRKTTDEKASSKEKEEKSKGMKILQRARSKPSLKIDVKASSQNASQTATSDGTTPVTPALSTGRTEVSASVIETPGSATPAASVSTAVAQPQPRGLSKRFSLSNMSQAFKRKSSMSNLHASAGPSSSSSANTPRGSNSSSESPVPMVPDLPEEYRKVKEAKGRKIKESAVPISPRKSQTLPVETSSGKASQAVKIDMSLDEVLTPTGLPRRSESLKAIQSLTFAAETEAGSEEQEPASMLPSGVLTKSPDLISSPIEDQTMIMGSTRERDQALLPALDLVPGGSTATIDRSTSPVSISMSSASSILDDDQAVEEEQEELVHAQLMHVSPRTRRDPSVSLQEFLASAPSRTGNVVIVPKGVRKSVEAIVIGSAVTGFSSTPSSIASGSSSPAFTPRARESVVLGVALDRVVERRGSETEEEDELATPMEEVVELFPAEMEQEQIEGEEEVLAGPGIMGPHGVDEVEDEDDDGFQIVSEPTPKATARVPSTHMQVDGHDSADVDLESLPSDTVLVETPPTPPPSQASPCGSTLTPVIAINGNGGSSDKNRFASPEALLKRLSSSKKSHHHHKAQSTPYHHPRSSTDKKDKKGKEKAQSQSQTQTQAQYQHIPIPPMPIPAPVPVHAPNSVPRAEDRNIVRGDHQEVYSALKNEVQLRSLHFDSLGLDFGGWEENMPSSEQIGAQA
ncbi:hypothetical protein IAT40_004604 [Kwoniella sp. CBS 6097]